jgi:hypothetical protein
MPDTVRLTQASLSQADLTVGALPEAEVKAPEEKATNLPEAPVPEKSLSGLELLNKKVAESIETPEGDGAGGAADEEEGDTLHTTQDGWIFAGNGPDDYKDPCVKPEAVLP